MVPLAIVRATCAGLCSPSPSRPPRCGAAALLGRASCGGHATAPRVRVCANPVHGTGMCCVRGCRGHTCSAVHGTRGHSRVHRCCATRPGLCTCAELRRCRGRVSRGVPRQPVSTWTLRLPRRRYDATCGSCAPDVVVAGALAGTLTPLRCECWHRGRLMSAWATLCTSTAHAHSSRCRPSRCQHGTTSNPYTRRPHLRAPRVLVSAMPTRQRGLRMVLGPRCHCLWMLLLCWRRCVSEPWVWCVPMHAAACVAAALGALLTTTAPGGCVRPDCCQAGAAIPLSIVGASTAGASGGTPTKVGSCIMHAAHSHRSRATDMPLRCRVIACFRWWWCVSHCWGLSQAECS